MTKFLFWTGIICGLGIFFVLLIPILLIASLGWLAMMIAFLISGV